MLWFWVAAALLGSALSALVLLRAARATQPPGEGDPEGAVYRRQLAEIDELAKRGLLDPAEVSPARAEAGRRLLASARRPEAPAANARRAGWVIAFAVAAPVAALALYVSLGAPGLADQPYDARVSAWRRADPATLGPSQMAAVLEAVTRERPRDVRALLYLARAQALSGEETAALRTLRRAAELEPRRAEIWSLAGELQAGGAEGPLPAPARAAFERALGLDPRDVAARYFLGRDLLVRGERAQGLRLWQGLLSDLQAGDPRREALSREMGRTEGDAGGAGRLKTDPAEMRMIEGMVAGLAERLEAQPNDPQGWGRLIRAYGVLDRPKAREQATLTARRLFRGQPEVLRQIDAAATDSSGW
ncbi:MAG TPA: c-type cytochrome biogenesis protein CcmI [Caulobacteraceae bacterium]|jgi:cytochrome c-type biogenesis protein CcmH